MYAYCILFSSFCFFPGEIDRETMASHSFHVTATDGSGLSATAVYSISVVDENDNSPLFLVGSSVRINLNEDHDQNEVPNSYCW